MINDWKKAEEVLNNGGIAVVPTDTLYGIVARALDKKAVERIYKIKGRDEGKPFIILITDWSDTQKFGVSPNFPHLPRGGAQRAEWSIFKSKTSYILPCKNPKFKYLHRGTNSLAFRLISPRNKNLFHILQTVGPLVAPSANPQGLTPAHTRKEARKYFGKNVDVYVCVGFKDSKPSTIISLTGNTPKILRA